MNAFKYIAKSLLVTATILTISLTSPTTIGATVIDETTNTLVNVLVMYDPTHAQEIDKWLTQNSVQVVDKFPELHALEINVPANKLPALRANEHITSIEPNYPVETATNYSWQIPSMNIPQAWQQQLTGKGVKIGIIDSGASLHNELSFTQRLSFVKDDPTTSIDDSLPDDNEGHGTHVAGIIGAHRGGPTVQGLDIAGIAPDAELYSLKALATKEGQMSDIIEAINWATDHQLDIVNMSFGSTYESTLLKAAIDRAASHGLTLVAAAGNDGTANSVEYPAAYDHVIAVSSVNEYGGLSGFSSYGAEVDFAAPGENVISTYVNGRYAMASGTSQAAPAVTGLLALIKEQYPYFTADQLRAHLQKLAVDKGPAGWDPQYGNGVLRFENIRVVRDIDINGISFPDVKWNEATVAFQGNTENVTYRVFLDGRLVDETSRTQVSFPDLEPEHTYEVMIQVVDEFGNASDGVRVQFETPAIRAIASLEQYMEARESTSLRISSVRTQYEVAEDVRMIVLDTAKKTSSKTWTITLSQPVDPASVVVGESVFVRENGEFVTGVQVDVVESGTKIVVKPPVSGYRGVDYTIYLAGVVGVNGKEMQLTVME